MKKIFLATVLFLTGCSCICPTTPVRVISNERDTSIYYNNEYIGADSTYVVLRSKDIKRATIRGEKKGCQTQILKPMYRFDWSVINIIDFRNIARLLTWDVYEAEPTKDMYNVTPKCY